MKRLIHYTSLLPALKILAYKKVKFSPIKKSNDLLEATSVDEFDSPLVFCTSIGEIDALTWIAYAKGKDGAAICFNFTDDSDYSSLFFDKDIESFPIEYVDSYYEYIGDNIDKIARVKENKFEKEHEYRYLIRNEKIDEDFRFVTINEKSLESIDLYVSIFAYDIIERLVKDIEKGGSLKLNVIKNDFIN